MALPDTGLAALPVTSSARSSAASPLVCQLAERLEGLAWKLEAYQEALSRLRWHTEDAYLGALLEAASAALEQQRSNVLLEARILLGQGGCPPRVPRTGEVRFSVQESTATLLAQCLAAGRDLVTRHLSALGSPYPTPTREMLVEQGHELGDIAAILERLASLLHPATPVVDAQFDDWLLASAPCTA